MTSPPDHSVDDRLGISFEPWSQPPHLGLLVETVHKGFLMASSKALQVITLDCT